MRLSRVLLLTLTVAFSAAQLQAGPHIIIHDPPPAFVNPVGQNFTFTSDSSGGGLLLFTNTSGVNWFDLYVFVPAPSPIASITCGTFDNTSFSACLILPGQMGYYRTVAFFGPPGITNGTPFVVDLGTGGWTPNATFQAEANIPEPGSLLLLAGGIVSVTTRRKLFLR